MAIVVPIWCYHQGMLSCACSLGLFTDDFLDHFPQPSLESISSETGARHFSFAVGSWLPQSLGGVCLVSSSGELGLDVALLPLLPPPPRSKNIQPTLNLKAKIKQSPEAQ